MKRENCEIGKRVRVLIADDSALVRESLGQLISSFAHLELVGEAKNGLEAIEMMGRLRPEVLILDIAMPGMNGLGVLQELKNRRQACYIIVLSAEREEIYRRKSLELGAKEFFEKTGEVESFFAALKGLERMRCK